MKQGNEIEKEFQMEGHTDEQVRESGVKMVYFQNDGIGHKSSRDSNNGDL
jgi:hypothetical protein